MRNRVGTALRQSRACRVDDSGHPQLHWFPIPLVLVPLALFAGIYVWRFAAGAQGGGGARRRRARGAGLQALAFAGGMLALLVALVSPLDGLGDDYLFSAHMVQHVLIGDIAPLLILLGLSRVIMRPATRRLTRLERRARPAREPGHRDRRLAGADVPLAHPRPLRRGRRASARAPARARLLLHGRRRALVAADPAGADAPPPHRAAADRLHRHGEGGPRGARASS